MADRRFRFDEPTDPWPNAPYVPGYAHDGFTRSFPASPETDERTVPIVGETRRVMPSARYTGVRGTLFGYVYELVLVGQPAVVCEYIGKTEQTMADRMRGHRSAEDIARDPWKARIKPGAAGYRILERVRCTGDGYDADRRALLRAEMDWIDRRRPLKNDVRPVRPRGEAVRERPTETRAERVRPVVRRTAAERRARRRAIGFLVLVAVLTGQAGRLVAGMALPWPWWASALTALVLGVTVATLVFLRALKFARRLRRY